MSNVDVMIGPFPPTTLPVRSGVYRTTQANEDGTLNGIFGWKYSRYDAPNRIWGCSCETPEEAAALPGYEFAWQLKSWYGLARQQ